MPLAVGATGFTSETPPFRYWYERRPFTFLDPALAAGANEFLITLQSVQGEIQGAGGIGAPLAAILSDWAMTPVTGVVVNASVSGAAQAGSVAATQVWPVVFSQQWPTVGWPSGLVPTLTAPADGIVATQTVQVGWANQTGSALSTPMQGTIAVAVTPLSVVQQVRIGWPLDAAAQALWEQYQAYCEPWDWATALDHVFGGAWLGDEERMSVLTASPTPVPAWPALSVPPGQVIVLDRLAVGLPNGAVGNQIQVQCYRDSNVPTHVLWADNSAGLATPWRPWMTALRQWQVQVSAETLTANLVLRARFRHYRLTPVMAALFGLTAPPTDRAQALAYNEARLGGWIR